MTQKLIKMSNNKFGFTFWLSWIFWFAASFVIAAISWTGLLTWMFGPLRGFELTLTWSVAVFGSWFILITPFMRKKEQIWKRLNQDEERAADAWLTGLGIFIGLAIASCVGWNFYFRSSGDTGFSWLKAVITTWLILLLPFLVVMYRCADQIFKDAVIRQGEAPAHFRTAFLEKSKRVLSEKISQKLRAAPAVLEGGYVVTAILKEGRRIPHVFIHQGKEMLGVYDRVVIDFEAKDIENVEIVEVNNLPAYEESKWLRLDGRA